MVTPQEHLRAARSFMDIRTSSLTTQIISMFLNELSLPKPLKNRYYEQRHRMDITTTEADVVFREAYPEFPMRIAVGPDGGRRAVTTLFHLQPGKKATPLWRMFLRHVESHVDALEENTPVIMILKLANMKTLHVMHCLDPEAYSIFSCQGSFYAMRQSEIWTFLQPLQDFLKISGVQGLLEEYVEREMGNYSQDAGF